MDSKRYSINLSDGTKIENLRLNGDNFISSSPVDASVFEGNCSPVLISDGEQEYEHAHMELIQIVQQNPGEYWIAMRDIPEEELSKIRMQSDIEYIAMMAGIEL